MPRYVHFFGTTPHLLHRVQALLQELGYELHPDSNPDPEAVTFFVEEISGPKGGDLTKETAAVKITPYTPNPSYERAMVGSLRACALQDQRRFTTKIHVSDKHRRCCYHNWFMYFLSLEGPAPENDHHWQLALDSIRCGLQERPPKAL